MFETKEKKSPGAFNFDMLTFIAENIPADVNWQWIGAYQNRMSIKTLNLNTVNKDQTFHLLVFYQRFIQWHEQNIQDG